MSPPATLSEFRNHQSDYIATAQREPVELTSRGVGRRAVVISPDLFDRAMQALEDQADVAAARLARAESEEISHADLRNHLGL